MKKYLSVFIAVAVAMIFLPLDTANGLGLKVAPLEYRTTIQAGEAKKGYVDVSNPATEKVIVKASVQAFRQINDDGGLQFYEDERLAEGIKLDLDEFELGPREAVRMYFELDGTKLPSGDVFGAIFFTLDPVQPKAGVGQSVRVGTILSIVNGTPATHTAQVTRLTVPTFQFDNTLQGSYTIKNTASPATASGFYPTVTVVSWPFGEAQQQAGKLVFAGRSRDNTFSLSLPPFGLYKITASYGNSSQSRWLLVAHPLSFFVAFILLLISSAMRRAFKRRSGLYDNDSIVK